MKKIISSMVCLSLVSLLCGCQGAKSRAAEGAVIGGVLGALAGGVIGHNDDRHAGEGLAIGAAAGIATGALIGSQISKQPGQAPAQVGQTQTAQTAKPVQANNPNQMSIQQVVELTKQGAHEAVIIDKLRMSNSRFNLTADDISFLQQQGVNQAVISVMQGG